jgi:hypothetical protein
MDPVMTLRRAFFALILILTLAVARPAHSQIPPLIVEAPAELAPTAERIRALDPARLADAARLAGLTAPGPPIRVMLVPEGSPLAERVPPWVSGFADPAAGVVVLLPARAPSFPDSSLEDLLRHEVAHVLIGRAAAGRPLPRWFHEGLAMIAGLSWGLEERSRLTLALFADAPIPLDELDRRFQGGQGTVQRAYTVAGAFVRDLVQRHGPEVTGEILAGVAAGLPFDEAFRRATGETLAAAGESFWSRQTFWYRWVPLLTSSVTLWILITMLALWAMRKRRARDAALRRIWEEEDRRAAEAAAAAAVVAVVEPDELVN